MLLQQIQSKIIILKIKLSVCISSCNHLQSRLIVRIVMGGATAGENTVKRSRPVEKYRQIYYTPYLHKNQYVFSIFHKNKKITVDKSSKVMYTKNTKRQDLKRLCLNEYYITVTVLAGAVTVLLQQIQSKIIILKIKLSVCISSCNHLQSRLIVRIVMGGATAGENTVKRSRPVEKYRQIYYTPYFHKNQYVFSIFHKNKKSPLTNRQR